MLLMVLKTQHAKEVHKMQDKNGNVEANGGEGVKASTKFTFLKV